MLLPTPSQSNGDTLASYSNISKTFNVMIIASLIIGAIIYHKQLLFFCLLLHANIDKVDVLTKSAYQSNIWFVLWRRYAVN